MRVHHRQHQCHFHHQYHQHQHQRQPPPPTPTPTPPISNITECKNLDETEESRTGFPDGRGSDNNGRESRAEDGNDLDDLDGWDGAIQYYRSGLHHIRS